MMLQAPLRSDSARFRNVVFPDIPRAGFPHNYAAAAAERAERIGPDPLSEEHRDFLRWIFRHAGLDAEAYRDETLSRRLPACLRLLRVRSVRDARSVLLADSSLIGPAVDALVIGVSSFFRDPLVFQTISATLLPAMLDRRRPLRVWSVGCSDGRELYSIGMLLAERGALGSARLLGTDCRTSAIRMAERGVYSQKDLLSVPAELRSRYFSSRLLGYEIDPELRMATQWRTANAIERVEPGSWDLILCRNLAMYLEPAVTARLWAQLLSALSPAGFIVTGKAERPGTATSACAPCMFLRNRDSGCEC